MHDRQWLIDGFLYLPQNDINPLAVNYCLILFTTNFYLPWETLLNDALLKYGRDNLNTVGRDLDVTTLDRCGVTL